MSRGRGDCQLRIANCKLQIESRSSPRFRVGTRARPAATRVGQTFLSAGHVAMRSPRRRAPRGLTLLEVILSLAILGGSLAVIGELARLGFRQAAQGRDLTRAALLCESKLAELSAGVATIDPVSRAAFADDTDWVYSVELESGEAQHMQLLKVTVERDQEQSDRPVQFTLVQWITDPNYVESVVEKADEIANEAAAKASSASKSSSSNASGPSGSSGTGAPTSGSGGGTGR